MSRLLYFFFQNFFNTTTQIKPNHTTQPERPPSPHRCGPILSRAKSARIKGQSSSDDTKDNLPLILGLAIGLGGGLLLLIAAALIIGLIVKSRNS
jgi:hypothetical protein